MVDRKKIIIGGLLILGIGVIYYYFVRPIFLPIKVLSPAPQPPASYQTTPAKTDNSSAAVTRIADPGVTWITPKVLPDLNLFKPEPEDALFPPIKTQYYEIAELESGGRVIFAQVEGFTLGGDAIFRFIKDKEGQYSMLYNHSFVLSIPRDNLADSVGVDYTTRYAGLSNPEFITFENQNLKKTPYAHGSSEEFFSDFDERIDDPLVLAGSTPYGNFYRWDSTIETEVEDKALMGRIFVLRRADDTAVYYNDVLDFLADDSTLIADIDNEYSDLGERSWRNGIRATGCGLPYQDQLYLTKQPAPQLTSIGTTKSGDKLYVPKNADDPIFEIAFESYKIGRYDDENQPIEQFDGSTVYSFDDFVAQKPLVIWQDTFGDFLILMDADLGELAECGKPVIYLYPEETTTVSVKVDADITKSDPPYGRGWEAIAEPSGRLTVAGKTYDSLFWEGQGAVYPPITTGRVVATENIETELRSDLNLLGLNNKESQDFLDFWLPKMPTTTYIRLTWLDTYAMNQLAPLTISPQPDTLIRIFLDFEGVDSPQSNLLPQHLGARKRRGFTAIEWGGLLRGQQ